MADSSCILAPLAASGQRSTNGRLLYSDRHRRRFEITIILHLPGRWVLGSGDTTSDVGPNFPSAQNQYFRTVILTGCARPSRASRICFDTD